MSVFAMQKQLMEKQLEYYTKKTRFLDRKLEFEDLLAIEALSSTETNVIPPSQY